MPRTNFRIIIVAFMAVFICGCETIKDPAGDAAKIESSSPLSLKVGITADYPPLIFKQDGKIMGVEAELAERLAKDLDRPLEFVELSWNQQIPSLLAGKTDIIMSGMTVTKAREMRIRFTEPYLKSGLLAAFRTEDRERYTSVESILNTQATIGVIKDTTGEVFAKNHLKGAERFIELSKVRDGGLELTRRVIDLFIHDAPAVVWLVSENEAELSGFWELLNTENLAWGITGENTDFEAKVNALLQKYKADGTLDKILDRWVPYHDKLK